MIKPQHHPPQPKSSSRSSPRIALIGCGAIAEGYYLPALVNHPSIMENLILVDQNFGRVQQLATAFNVSALSSDYQETIGKVDGVIIALPTHLHHRVAMEFLALGVHVLCEKPLSESADKAMEMVELADKTGAILAVNNQQRLWPQFIKVKEVITEGSLGNPVRIMYNVGEIFRWPTVSGFYFNSPGSGRGILRDRGAHVIDHICWWLGGKPKVVDFQNDAIGGSEAVARVSFKHNACVGEVKLSWLTSFPCRFTVEFERGSIEGEVYYPQSILLRTNSGSKKRIHLKSENYTILGYRMITNFINAITGSEKPIVPGRDVLDSMAFIDDCYASSTRFDMPWYKIPEVEK